MRRTLALLAALSLPVSGSAADFAGARPFDFLFIDSGARAAALGGAFTAGRNDADILAYNPAGLSSLEGGHVAFSHTQLFSGAARERVVAAGDAGWGVSADYLSYGGIRRTTLSNPTGDGLNEFTPSATAFSVGFGLPLGPEAGAGAALKHLRESIDGVEGSAWAADAGWQGLILREPRIAAGIAVQNIGPDARFLTRREKLPRLARAGLAHQASVLEVPIALTGDVVHFIDGPNHLLLGLAVSPVEMLAVRAGLGTKEGPGFSFGFGLRRERWRFDYALVPFGELGSMHQLSFGMRWESPALRRRRFDGSLFRD